MQTLALARPIVKRAAVGASRDACFVEIDGVRLAYDDIGAGRTIVGLHATGHGSGDFARVREQLARRFRVITLDWPGHGRSDADSVGFDAERCAWILAAFLERLDLRHTIVIGNSIGGAAALIAASRSTERIAAVVACDPGGLAPIDPLARLFCRMMGALGDAGTRGAWWFAPVFSAFCRLVLQTREAATQRARIAASGYEVAGPIAQAWRSFMRPEADLRDLGPRVAQPVLFAWASRDLLVALAKSRAALERFPHRTLRTFAAGHCAFLERPAEFLVAFDTFVYEAAGSN